MIITEKGVDADRLTPELARLIGDGSGFVAEAAETSCGVIEPVHILGYLARMGGSIVRTQFLEPRRVDVDGFRHNLYEVALDSKKTPRGISGFGRRYLSEASLRFFEDFERKIDERELSSGNEEIFTVVLFEHIGEAVRRLLVAVTGSDDSFERFVATISRRIAAPVRQSVFDRETGKLVESAFDKSGRRVLSLLREETAGLGYDRASIKHLLYALVEIENGVVQHALQFQAIDPIRDVHSFLSRELTRPGAKRVPNFELSRSSLHESVARVLEAAAGEAHREVALVSELYIARALLAMRPTAIEDFLISRHISVDVLTEYLSRTEAEYGEATDNLRLPIPQIEEALSKQILGQDHVIQQILPWIKRLRFGFPRDRGAAAVFLFLGPSGTGKTQLAKELARTVYGSEDQLVMLEMGQFNSRESINIFIGAPPGYVGYGEGKLTNGLRDKPESVVLFDEIEKAHEDVWVALLRFLDEGLISDPAGPTRDGRKCIVVLTSNLGSEKLENLLPADAEAGYRNSRELEQAIREVVLTYLKRPEIYNRVDDKLVFRAFDDTTYAALVKRQVETESRKFREIRDTRVEVEPDVIDYLATLASQSKDEGARCVPRLVNLYVVSKVVDLLTRNEDAHLARVTISKDNFDTKAQ